MARGKAESMGGEVEQHERIPYTPAALEELQRIQDEANGRKK
jgi:hypothetical protein